MDQLPSLRVGFIETGASWVPYLHADLMAKHLRLTSSPFELKSDVFS